MLISFDSTPISIYSFLSINAWSSNNAIFDKKYMYMIFTKTIPIHSYLEKKYY